jgi:anti-anti-sigma factor
MNSDIYEENGTTIIAPDGRLDTLSAPEFGRQLEKLLTTGPGRCLIDMGRVDYLSSSGLRVLLAGAKTADREKIDFGVFGMNEMVNEVFTISGFNHFITAYPGKKEALAG